MTETLETPELRHGRTLREYPHPKDAQTREQLIEDFLKDPVKRTTIREVEKEKLQKILNDPEKMDPLVKRITVLNFLSDEASDPTLRPESIKTQLVGDNSPIWELPYNTQKRRRVFRKVKEGYDVVKKLLETGLISLGADAPASDYNTFVDRSLYEDMLEETDALIATLMDENVIPLPNQLQAGIIHIRHNIETLLFGRNLEETLALRDEYSIQSSAQKALKLFTRYFRHYAPPNLMFGVFYHTILLLAEIRGHDVSGIFSPEEYYKISYMFCVLEAGISAGVEAREQHRNLWKNRGGNLLLQETVNSELFSKREKITKEIANELKGTHTEDVVDIAILFTKCNDRGTLQKLLVNVASGCKGDPILNQVLEVLDKIRIREAITTITPLVVDPRDPRKDTVSILNNVAPENELKTNLGELCELLAVIKKRYPSTWPTVAHMKDATSTETQLSGFASIGTATILTGE